MAEVKQPKRPKATRPMIIAMPDKMAVVNTQMFPEHSTKQPVNALQIPRIPARMRGILAHQWPKNAVAEEL